MFALANFMPFGAPFRASRLALLLFILAAGLAQAEKADRDKPMHIEADRLRFDEAKQLRVISGNVVITKGSIVIRGAHVELRQDPAGHQHAKVTAEAGRRAFFRQKRDGVDEFIEGESQTIDYDGKSESVKFVGQAELRRLRGATLVDHMSGNLISYDNQSEVFNVDGASPAAGVGASGRIRLMLTPSPAAAAAPAPAGAVLLRPSSGLTQETK